SLESDVYDESRECMVACVRGRGYRKTFLSSERLRYPMVRVGERGEGKFKRISWDEAIDLMKEKLETITSQYGVGSRYVNYGCGDTGITDGRGMMKRLLSATGGFLDYHNSYSSACQSNALPYTYGTAECSSSFSTYLDSKLLILWANNPLVTEHNGEIIKVLKHHKKLGTPIVVIDPHYNETAATYATMWLPIRPGTDCALASSVAYVLWEEGMVDEAFLKTYCIGFDKDHMPEGFEGEESYKDYIYGTKDGILKTPEWAEKITGLKKEKIVEFARLYGTSKPAALLPGLGNNRVSNGEQNVRAMTILQCLTGNVGKRGGSTGGRGDKHGHHTIRIPKGPNPYGRSIPCFLWTDAITRGSEMTRKKDGIRGSVSLDSSIKILFNIAGNALINQHSDINETSRILRDTSLCEFIVVSDLFMTPSAKFADLLLPGASFFECPFITMPWHDGNYLLCGNKVIEPLFEGKNEIEWITELAKRMGVENFLEEEDVEKLLALTYERFRSLEPELPPYSIFQKEGGYRYLNNMEFIPFQEQIEDPLHHPFPTPSGKIEFFSPRLLEFEDPVNVPPVPKYVPAFETIEDEKYQKYPLQLIGWHTKRRTHTVHDNNSWMEDVEPNRVYMNPKDAERRELREGDYARVFNDRGAVEIQVTITPRIMEGVVCIPQGAWYNPDERGVDVRGCVNTLSTLVPTPIAKGNPQHSSLCEIEKVPS
ncbi:MAG: molybdopterin-dependent oxidoreductase, partial [Spirochaetales bacterium]|nr:molybdopterin-dependent oxidoreductase [Candidatus Physcosoma equi]